MSKHTSCPSFLIQSTSSLSPSNFYPSCLVILERLNRLYFASGKCITLFNTAPLRSSFPCLSHITPGNCTIVLGLTSVSFPIVTESLDDASLGFCKPMLYSIEYTVAAISTIHMFGSFKSLMFDGKHIPQSKYSTLLPPLTAGITIPLALAFTDFQFSCLLLVFFSSSQQFIVMCPTLLHL